ncbi:hypothetical protein M2404_001192 [Rheinheimera pacifica]|uniref:hypothetical protein n=1 Tax=Rheinheimera pacifica TaxID=173990 RepID=UPI0021697BB1|nr:hypothetical protein [Rheinheimera pacifica]MCS4306867.1 hypothetical protein [Rheinheimera pacifica]
MRFLLLLLASIALLSCSEPNALSAPEQPENIPKHDPKQYSLLNEQMVYTARFAEIFGLDPTNAIELNSGVLAIRIYWTVFANRDAVYAMYEPHEYRDKLPVLQIQLFLEDSVPVQLDRNEGTQYNYESFVRSGFRYFQHKAPQPTEEIEQADYQEFYNRVILRSEVEEGVVTRAINRYKKSLVPSITALEFVGLFRTPFDIYLYTGKEPARSEFSSIHVKRISESRDNYDTEQFFRLTIPDELAPVLKQPYRE